MPQDLVHGAWLRALSYAMKMHLEPEELLLHLRVVRLLVGHLLPQEIQTLLCARNETFQAVAPHLELFRRAAVGWRHTAVS